MRILFIIILSISGGWILKWFLESINRLPNGSLIYLPFLTLITVILICILVKLEKIIKDKE